MTKIAKLLSVLTLISLLCLVSGGSAIVTAGTITGTKDQDGVWLFSAGTSAGTAEDPQGTPGGEPTDEIVNNAILAGKLELLGDVAPEVIDWHSGPSDTSDEGPRDTTLAQVVEGLSAIDDFGFIANPYDPPANYDAGIEGWVTLGNIGEIHPDGVVANGIIGPEDHPDPEAALGGFEIFIFEDAELSGFTCTLTPKDGLPISFEIANRQVNPNTTGGADDTLIAIDLDNLPGFSPDDSIISINITDDGITMIGDPLWPDTTLELDAVATRVSVIEYRSSISGYKWNDTSGEGNWDLGEPGIEGWIIYLSGDETDWTITGPGGYYIFPDLPAGSYTVSEKHLPYWTQTYPDSPGTHSVTLNPPANSTDNNFGNHLENPPPSVGGRGKIITVTPTTYLPVILAISLIGVLSYEIVKKRRI